MGERPGHSGHDFHQVSDDDHSDASQIDDPPTKHDRAVLEEDEEQQENVLAGGYDSSSRDSAGNESLLAQDRSAQRKEQRRLHKRKPKRKPKGSAEEEGKLMYDMEEGGSRDDLSSSSSSSVELDRLKDPLAGKSKSANTIRTFVIATVITVAFLLLTYGSYKISHRRLGDFAITSLSNGTSAFAPTTILISLDGFRADFLHRNLTPTLNSFIAEGVSPKYMLPSFPSVTFPNHYTLVTGLHPESHGVVGNSFWDPELREEFYYTDPARSMQPKWWAGGEPIWATAERQGVKTAIHMWPGSEAHIDLEPTFLDKFNGSEILIRKVDRILGLLDLPPPDEYELEGAITRPQLIAAYVPVVDSDGHKYGPNSTEIRGTIADVDIMLNHIFRGIIQRNLSDIVNIVIVSDHGMATTSVDRLIQLDNLIDLDLIEHIDGWPLYGLRPKNPDDLQPLYQKLLTESANNPNFEVYLRDENMPARYHFSHNDRIAPLWVIPKTGWAIVHKEDFDVKAAKAKGETYHPKGLHGYDHEHPLMRAIFVAKGPAFPHQPNSRLKSFQNIEVYNIICDTLGIEPIPNNGTLRLPLKTEGLHSDQPVAVDDLPEDLPGDNEAPTSAASSNAVTSTPSQSVPTSASTTAVTNSTTDPSEDSKSSDDTMWGKWKQMMEEVRAAMADLYAKIHGTSDAGG